MERNARFIFFFWSLLFAFLLICNILLLPVSDDLIHMEIAKGGFQAAVENYMTTNARFGQCLLCWFAGAMHPLAFDFLNASIGTIFIFLLFILIEGKVPVSRSDYGELSFIVIAILLATMFGSVFLWMSGATNYLWGYTLIALHWIPYRLYWKNGGFQMNAWLVLPFFILSVCAGWSSEQVGIMSILVHGGLLTYGMFAKKIKFPVWVWMGFVGFVIGFLILYFSPGINERAAESDAEKYIGLSQILSLGAVGFAKRLILTIGYASSKVAFDVLLLTLSCYIMAKKGIRKEIIIHAIVILSIVFALSKLEPVPVQVAYFYFRIFASIILFGVAIYYSLKKNLVAIMYVVYFIALLSTIQLTGHIPERAKFAQSFILLSMSIFLLREIWPNFMLSKLITIVCCITAMGVISAYVDYNHKQREVISIITDAKNKGEDIAILPSNLFQSPYKNIGDWGELDSDPDHWANKGYEDYFGIRIVAL